MGLESCVWSGPKPKSLEHRTTSPLPLTLLQSIHTHTLGSVGPTATIPVSELQFVRPCVSTHSRGLDAPFCNSLSSSETTGAWKLIAQSIEGTFGEMESITANEVAGLGVGALLLAAALAAPKVDAFIAKGQRRLVRCVICHLFFTCAI